MSGAIPCASLPALADVLCAQAKQEPVCLCVKVEGTVFGLSDGDETGNAWTQLPAVPSPRPLPPCFQLCAEQIALLVRGEQGGVSARLG